MFTVPQRAQLLYDHTKWSLQTEDIPRLKAFDHRCLRSVDKMGWSDGYVRNLALGTGSENILSLSRHYWLGHMLHMANARLLYRALFSVPPTERKEPRGSQ